MGRRSAGLIIFVALAACLAPPGPSAAGIDPEKVAAFKAAAVDLISDRNYDSKASEHFLVRTDDPRVDVVKTSAFLEAVWAHLEEQFGALTGLRESGEPLDVMLFYSRYKYNQLAREVSVLGEAGSIGHYRADLELLAAHTDTVGPGDLPGLLSHETAHHFVYTRLYGRGLKGMSRWTSEGLGTYVGFTRMDRKGRFLTGEIGGQEAQLLRDTPNPRAEIPSERLSRFKSLVKKAEPGFLDDLVHRDSQEIFYADEPGERYTAAWLLVHFLLHGRDGALARPFMEFLREDARGHGSEETLYRLVGMDAEALERAFVEYVKKLKAR